MKEAPTESQPSRRSVVWTAANIFVRAYSTEVLLFAGTFILLAAFSSHRFVRQSEAPHFVYQAKAWLDGRVDIDAATLPNPEDWACVREVSGRKVRCEGRPLLGDRWYVSFPPFPAVLMMPFVAVHGYQLNDTSFTVAFAALAVALFYSLLRFLSYIGDSPRAPAENLILALTLPFGTVFFYCAIRGEVWFTAEILGVVLTCLYVRNSVRARHPILAGFFFSMAVLTRTPLLFAGVFFLAEAVWPNAENRIAQLRDVVRRPVPALRRIALFAAGAAPLAVFAAVHNFVRFGSPTEFGHRFLYANRVNADIDRLGLFNIAYLPRNLEAALLKLPSVQLSPLRIDYDPHGLSLLLTLPVLVLLFVPKERRRLQWPLWIAVACCALPGLLYQNTGYMQFGFRFSLDYTPYLLVLLALSGWALNSRITSALLALGFVVNFWGAVAFRGYTELVRGW